MIYIHELKTLNPKSAEIESVPIIRELKEKAAIPVSQEHIFYDFGRFMVKDSDIKLMEDTAEILPLAMKEVADLSEMGKNAEEANLKRIYLGLLEIQDHLRVNIDYAKQVFSWQSQAIPEITALIRKASSLKTSADKKAFNEEISPVFEKILRNSQFTFRFWDLVHEAQVERIKGIIEGMSDGVLFHMEPDEYAKKIPFSEIRNRLLQQELVIFDSIAAKAPEIKKGVDIAYDMNMRMVCFAVQFYSYLRWLGGI